MASQSINERHQIPISDESYPSKLKQLANPPETLYIIGNPNALAMPSIATIGARRATPYGTLCARRFAALAVEHNLCIISGGARGIDTAAHRAALDADGVSVAVLAGGCDVPYPAENEKLFQQIVETGGALVSERPWGARPLPYMFRQRNRLTMALADVVLLCEAGFPSGSFSACDEASALSRPILAVPGNITSATSRGPNELICLGATPVIDDKTFLSALADNRFPIDL